MLVVVSLPLRLAVQQTALGCRGGAVRRGIPGAVRVFGPADLLTCAVDVKKVISTVVAVVQLPLGTTKGAGLVVVLCVVL